MNLVRITKGLAIFAALLLILSLYPGELEAEESYKDRYEEKFQKTVDLAKDGHVYLSNISGDIEITSWQQNKVKIDAIKSSKHKEHLAMITIEVEKTGKTLNIKTRYPKRWDKWFSGSFSGFVQYRLWIPDKASIEVKTVSGDIDVEKIGGLVELNAVSGDITVNRANEGVDCQTVSGELTLDDITGDADLQTVSGEIVVNRIKGSIEVQTVSGEIELMDVSEARDVETKTVSGDIDYKGDINPQGRYVLKSHSGDIDMILPADSGFELEAETYSGHIDCDFQISLSGRIKPRHIRGMVNKGGALVRLSTFSGSITVEKR